MWQYNNTPELYHFGIKGQKWGVRRFQNEDGSLTEAGKKRYNNMSSEQLMKEMNKYVKKQKGQIHGSSNRWTSGLDIGENSKKALDEHNKRLKNLKNSERAKLFNKEMKQLHKKYDSIDMTLDNEKKLLQEEKNLREKYSDLMDAYSRDSGVWIGLGSTARAGKEYLNGFGREITNAYIKDLGCNQEASDWIAKKINNAGMSF